MCVGCFVVVVAASLDIICGVILVRTVVQPGGELLNICNDLR